MSVLDRIRKIASARRADARRVREQAALLAKQHLAILQLCDALNGHTYAIHELKAHIATLEFHVDALRQFIMEQSQALPGEHKTTQHGRGPAH